MSVEAEALPAAGDGPAQGVFLRAESITKRFGHLLANDEVSLQFRLGEIHALLGENGAGKSTLIKILAGIYTPDGGTIYVDDAPVSIQNPTEARRLGISVVHQRLELVPTLTVLENVALQESGLGRLDRKALAVRTREVATQLGFSIKVDARVESLSVGDRQRVEIVRALMAGGRLVILDEPTSLLAPTETDALFDLLERLANQGSAVVFVTHRLKEAVAHSHRSTVLRQGRVVGRVSPGDDITEDEIVHLMVGEVDTSVAPRSQPDEGSPYVLSAAGVSGRAPTGGELHDVELNVRAGEIMGIAGVEGNGQAELAALVTGSWVPAEGTVLLRGRPIHGYPPSERCRLVADIPESLTLAVAPELCVWENIGLHTMLWESGPSIRERARLRGMARERIDEFDIRTRTVDSPVSTLSGGNQQRVLVARELSKDSVLIVASYATRGLDVRSAAQVRRWVRDLADRGAGVIYISSDMEELFDLSDRIAVLFHGRVVGVRETSSTTVRQIGSLMVGGSEGDD
jgi:general nucleoside transport system ATP-binding protein